ncbi:hypothetical protein [Streptomyces aurantiogriseus]|uniref:Uncharacterized protein n=1 Tax=Streptomyces aurantiogriseus TaxID=66870 RepID=A0A918F548_9ACTN|nr:hypothetical protein [Streptomyces aurantiogriseus]GGR08722.1 hypothetical protein GCM10010251_25450 [Streptomyces aurantiogriseus]
MTATTESAEPSPAFLRNLAVDMKSPARADIARSPVRGSDVPYSGLKSVTGTTGGQLAETSFPAPDTGTESLPAGLGPDRDAVDDLAELGVVGRSHHAETA